MDVNLTSTARDALQDLLDVSPQVEAALIMGRDGRLLADSLEGRGTVAERLARIGTRLLGETERARTELGREPVTQCEVATGDGHVFLVGDAERVVLAVTGVEPTVGLVFYDMKTALRAVRETTIGRNNGHGASSNGAVASATAAARAGTEGDSEESSS
jgi:predicted regulator of Ras-like GTPase activity (Roadblock/LC7/MglB family)